MSHSKNDRFDVVVLTDRRYVNPAERNDYINNVLLEDRLVIQALERKGLNVTRTNWDDPNFDWSTTRSVLFRTTWDYFDRFEEFWNWVEEVRLKTLLINSFELLKWNSDKHYLQDLERSGVRIIPTYYVEPGDKRSLADVIEDAGFGSQVILKPAIAGAARHTYKLNGTNVPDHEAIFNELVLVESMLIQPFQHRILDKGELSFMVFNGVFSHAVLKVAKPGDFRVQDDFGGTVHAHQPTSEEIEFALFAVSKCNPKPIYARVDVVWDNENRLAVSELELIEPELWFRNDDHAADLLAEGVNEKLL